MSVLYKQIHRILMSMQIRLTWGIWRYKGDISAESWWVIGGPRWFACEFWISWCSYEPETRDSPLQTLSIMRWLRNGAGWIKYCLSSADSMVLNGGLFHPMLEIYIHFALHRPRHFRLRFTWHIKRRLSNALLLWFLQKASDLCCCSSLLPFNGNQGHLKPPCTADTHTRWKLPAKSGGATFSGVGGILLLAAQLRDSG